MGSQPFIGHVCWKKHMKYDSILRTQFLSQEEINLTNKGTRHSLGKTSFCEIVENGFCLLLFSNSNSSLSSSWCPIIPNIPAHHLRHHSFQEIYLGGCRESGPLYSCYHLYHGNCPVYSALVRHSHLIFCYPESFS